MVGWTFLIYIFLVIGILLIAKTRSFHMGLSLLVFSSTLVGGVGYNSTYIAVVSWFALSILFSYLFYWEYEPLPTKHREDESFGDVIMGYLLGFFILWILKAHGAGWMLSLLVSYLAFYSMLVISYRNNRRAFYLLKVPWVVFSWGALVEEFGLQKELTPFLVVYALIFILWLGFDLPRLWRPPRIT